jgi:16S rRNA (cytosine967-C5)-methyltransferase
MQLEMYATIAQKLVAGYAAPEPMHMYLQKYFKLNKKHGSRDRKTIANMVYSMMRSGLSIASLPSQILEAYEIQDAAKAIYSFEPATCTISVNRTLFDQLSDQANEKYPFTLKSLTLSDSIDADAFRAKLFIKPFTFVRWRSHKKMQSELPHQQLGQKSVAFLADAKLQQETFAESDYVIQDFNSQAVCAEITLKERDLVWDCCCASGGKSLALLDHQSRITLYASDIRPQVLKAYQHRLAQYGYKAENTFVADLSSFEFQAPFEEGYFNHVICDVPCSGSGTWARTPENYSTASQDFIQSYSMLQVAIATKAAQYLKVGGMLHYITCSVFECENEQVVKQILAADDTLELVKQKLFTGELFNCDYMYVAQLVKKG